ENPGLRHADGLRRDHRQRPLSGLKRVLRFGSWPEFLRALASELLEDLRVPVLVARNLQLGASEVTGQVEWLIMKNDRRVVELFVSNASSEVSEALPGGSRLELMKLNQAAFNGLPVGIVFADLP